MNAFYSIQIQLLTGTTLGNRTDIQQLLTPGMYTPLRLLLFAALSTFPTLSGNLRSEAVVPYTPDVQAGWHLAGLFRSTDFQMVSCIPMVYLIFIRGLWSSRHQWAAIVARAPESLAHL